jgi:hypothetical protein
MGATLMRRSMKRLRFSTEMPAFVVFFTRVVSAGFLRIPGSLSFAGETLGRHDAFQAPCLPGISVMATIKVRKQGNGTTRYGHCPAA